MTGFGEGRGEDDAVAVAVEARSINNRHLKVNCRTSDGYQPLEPRLERLVRDRVKRGTVSLSVRVQRRSIAADYQLNTEVLLGYQEQLSRLGGVDAVPPL
ncbi:MAG: YicC/YloC family endoribonuclease, partial [Planctomycetota bacterium]